MENKIKFYCERVFCSLYFVLVQSREEQLPNYYRWFTFLWIIIIINVIMEKSSSDGVIVFWTFRLWSIRPNFHFSQRRCQSFQRLHFHLILDMTVINISICIAPMVEILGLPVNKNLTIWNDFSKWTDRIPFSSITMLITNNPPPPPFDLQYYYFDSIVNKSMNKRSFNLWGN